MLRSTVVCALLLGLLSGCADFPILAASAGVQRPNHPSPDTELPNNSAKLINNNPSLAQNPVTLSFALLAFGVIVLGLEVAVIWRQRDGWNANSTRIFGISLVIVMGTFLVVAGYDGKQMAALIGLLGTIVGYLLGKSEPAGKK